jgi:hypothetical protein
MSGIADLLDTDPAGGVLAAAELRETRAKTLPAWDMGPTDEGHEFRLLPEGHHGSYESQYCEIQYHHSIDPQNGAQYAHAETIAEHVAAEADPAHALAEAALWRVIVKSCGPYSDNGMEVLCGRGDPWPCPDLSAAVDAARAYLGDTR